MSPILFPSFCDPIFKPIALFGFFSAAGRAGWIELPSAAGSRNHGSSFGLEPKEPPKEASSRR